MADALEGPATLRRKAERCERLAEQCPTPRDAELLRKMAREYRRLADRQEAVLTPCGPVTAGTPVR